jgi:hypothetical protein
VHCVHELAQGTVLWTGSPCLWFTCAGFRGKGRRHGAGSVWVTDGVTVAVARVADVRAILGLSP